MIGYIDYAPSEGKDQGCEKPRSNGKAFGGSSRTSAGNQPFVGYGGSYGRDVVQTTRTEYHDYYSFGAGLPVAQQQPQSNKAQLRELTSRIKNEDKETGSYQRVTMKEKMSKGETYVEKSTGRSGIASEYKKSATAKIGDRSGYTEYYHEDRVRRVNYDGTSNSRMMQGSKNTSISVNHANAGIKKNTSISVNHGKNKSTSLSINYGNSKKGTSSGKRMAK